MEHLDFHKTSQRFGHWRDQATGTVYGIGFKTEQQLEDFADCIKKAKAAFSSTTSSSTSTNKKMSKKTSLTPLLNNEPEHVKLRELMSRLGLDTEPVKGVGDQFMELEVILPPREVMQNIQQEKQELQNSLSASQDQHQVWKGQLELLRCQSEELGRAILSLEIEIEEKKMALDRMSEREAAGLMPGEVRESRETGQGDGGCDELEKHYKSLLESANRMFSEAMRPVGGGGAADALFCKAIHELTGLHGEVVRGRRCGGGGDGEQQD